MQFQNTGTNAIARTISFVVNDGSLGSNTSSRALLSASASSSLSFNGTNDYVQVADSPSLHPQSGVTIEAWVQFASSAGGSIVAKPVGSAAADSFVLWYQNGALHGSIGENLDHIDFPWAPSVNTWYHVAFTFDSAAQTRSCSTSMAARSRRRRRRHRQRLFMILNQC